MHYFLRFLYSSIFIYFLVGEIPMTVAGRTPSRKYEKLRPGVATGGAINVAGLDVLRTYVCPPCANTVRRQIDTKRAGAITVAIPVAEISELWQELQWILEQLSILLEAEGLLPASTPRVGLLAVLASLTESAMPVTVLPSAPIEVSNPSMTNSVLFATAMPETAMASISLKKTAFANSPEVTDRGAGASAVPSTVLVAATTVVTPGSAPSFLLGLAAVSTFQIPPTSSEASSITDWTSVTQGSMCYATQTIDETTTVSQLAVTAFEAAATSSSTVPDSTFASAADGNIPTLASPIGGVFVATSVSSGLSSTGLPSYKFDSQSTQNIAVYYGQSGATGETTLEAQCADPNIDIVILAFVITRNYQGKYPDVNFGAACGGQTLEMVEQAPGLLSCPQLEGYIDICQQTYGKKVLLSVGGSTSSLRFSSALEAFDFANILWQLFGPPGSLDIQLRPFGNVSIDGFDIDNENKLPEYFDTFASTLRANYGSDTSKSYYLSSAPQCPFPDASDPLPMLLLCDFVYVQFYNNPPCEIGSSNFINSIQQWSMALSSSTLHPKPRLYLGAPAWSTAGNSAYEHIGNAEGMQGIAKSVKDMNLVNFGGVMLWDGAESLLNTEGGKDILGWTKAGLAQ